MAEQPSYGGSWVEIAIACKEFLLRNVQDFGFFFFYLFSCTHAIH